jgi:hypothetical protein
VAAARSPTSTLDVRSCISGLAQLPDGLVARRMEQLAADVAEGNCQTRHAGLTQLDVVDGGFRLVVPMQTMTPQADPLRTAGRCAEGRVGRCRMPLAPWARGIRGVRDSFDQVPAWCALGRIRRKQLLGQQFQCLACVATPHQGDWAHDVCTKTFWM